jgi:type I restriction enzyme R subunit
MVVSLDKFTAVKMYDKVQRLWKEQIKQLRGQINESKDEDEKKRLQKQVDYMRSAQMAVIVSEGGRRKEVHQAETRHQTAPRSDEQAG